MQDLLEGFKYMVPMLVLGCLFYWLLEKFFKEQRQLRALELKKLDRDLFLPQKFQAYERMAIFIERIKPTHLVRRIPLGKDANAYEFALVNAIQEEFDHNASQQIYIDPETWKVIFSAKNATQNYIKQSREKLSDTNDVSLFQQALIKNSMDAGMPLNSAMLKLQQDIQITI